MSGTETATSGASATSGYVHPEVLVETSWVAEHLNDPSIRLIEADEDVLLYEVGHLPGAVKLDWHVDVQDPLARDFEDHEWRKAEVGSRGSSIYQGYPTICTYYLSCASKG